MSSIVRAGGLIVYRVAGASIEFLLLQASYPPYHWTPPKGHVDEGEDELKAAIRETLEEAGLSSDQLEVQQAFCETLRYTTKEGPKAVCYWPARFTGVGDVRLSHEHQQYTWVALKEAMELVQYPEMAALLSAAQRFLAAQ